MKLDIEMLKKFGRETKADAQKCIMPLFLCP